MSDVLFGATCFFNDPKDFLIVLEVEKNFPFMKYIEFRGEHPFCFPGVTADEHFRFYKDVLSRSSLRSTMHTTMYDINLASLNPWIREAGVACYKKYIDLSEFLGSEVIVVHGGYLDHDFIKDELMDHFMAMAEDSLCQSLIELAEYGAAKNVKVGLENSPWEIGRSIVYDIDTHLKILKRVDHEYCGALLDFAHAFLRKLDLADYVRALKPYLVEIHAHNNMGENDDHMGLTLGKIDYAEVLELPEVAGVPFIMEIKSYEQVVETLSWLGQKYFS